MTESSTQSATAGSITENLSARSIAQELADALNRANAIPKPVADPSPPSVFPVPRSEWDLGESVLAVTYAQTEPLMAKLAHKDFATLQTMIGTAEEDSESSADPATAPRARSAASGASGHGTAAEEHRADQDGWTNGDGYDDPGPEGPGPPPF